MISWRFKFSFNQSPLPNYLQFIDVLLNISSTHSDNVGRKTEYYAISDESVAVLIKLDMQCYIPNSSKEPKNHTPWFTKDSQLSVEPKRNKVSKQLTESPSKSIRSALLVQETATR